MQKHAAGVSEVLRLLERNKDGNKVEVRGLKRKECVDIDEIHEPVGEKTAYKKLLQNKVNLRGMKGTGAKEERKSINPQEHMLEGMLPYPFYDIKPRVSFN